jgi:hypothetical protein
MLTAIGDVLRECYARGWITTRDGNISLRMSLEGQISPHMHITPKGVRKNTIHPEHIIKVNIDSSASTTDVSTEFHMHRNLLIDAKSTRCVAGSGNSRRPFSGNFVRSGGFRNGQSWASGQGRPLPPSELLSA